MASLPWDSEAKASPARPVVIDRSVRGSFGLRIVKITIAAILILFIGSRVLLQGLRWSNKDEDLGLHVISTIDETISAALDTTPSVAHVPLEVYTMSKCPDAQYCMEQLIVPTMANVSNLVDLRIDYIGDFEDDSYRCKHGDDECKGNVIELCAIEEYGNAKKALGFINCLTADYEMIPSDALLKSCAAVHGVDVGRIRSCVDRDHGAHGKELLRRSFARSKAKGVTLSCTVRVNDQLRCIRDGGQWKQCKGGSEPQDLIRDIKRAAKRSASVADALS